MIDASRPWLELSIDFFVSWNDEFGVLHKDANALLDPGFKKAYGGSAFVSFFDTVPGTEGVGVEVNPVTQNPIISQHMIQVQNTPGLKEITVRFRSKQSSVYFVDVPIIVEVLAPPTGLCLPPVTEPCGEMLLKKGQLLLTNLQSAASVPAVQDVAGTPGTPVDRDLLYVSLHSATVGAAPQMRVRFFQAVPSNEDVGGVKWQQIGADTDYLPLSTPAPSPNPGGFYGAPRRLTLAFDVAALKAMGVGMIDYTSLDGSLRGSSQYAAGPSLRDIGFFPLGGAGGGDACVYV